MNEVEKNASDNISRILVGNKCDLESQRQVTKEEGQELAEHFNVRFLETSAKECMNVEDAFTMMTREMKNRVTVIQPKRNQDGNGQPKTLGKSKDIKKQKSGCCWNQSMSTDLLLFMHYQQLFFFKVNDDLVIQMTQISLY